MLTERRSICSSLGAYMIHRSDLRKVSSEHVQVLVWKRQNQSRENLPKRSEVKSETFMMLRGTVNDSVWNINPTCMSIFPSQVLTQTSEVLTGTQPASASSASFRLSVSLKPNSCIQMVLW